MFQFGAYGSLWVLVFEPTLETALETAADWLAEHAPGHIMRHDSEALAELFSAALSDLDPSADPDTVWQDDNDLASRASERAVADLTYTEAGYLTPHEWGVSRGGYSRADLRSMARPETVTLH